MSIVLGILTFALIVLSLFLVLIVLAQKAKSDGGVGAAMGGGMTEAAFGADTGNVLQSHDLRCDRLLRHRVLPLPRSHLRA